MTDWEAFLYRCEGCGTVKAMTIKMPSPHEADCAVCAVTDPTRSARTHHAIYIEVAGSGFRFRLKGW